MRRIVGVLPLLLLFRCATMLNGRDEVITIDSEPAGASVALTCADGSTYNGVTPMAVPVRRNAGDCNINVARDGYATQNRVLESGISRTFWGNMITVPMVLCGFIGFNGFFLSEPDGHSRAVGTGCLAAAITTWTVDGKSGAWRDHDPKKLKIELKPSD